MKRTVTINISGNQFYIDEDAYSRLRNYLDKIESTFRQEESGDEIITDIESRIAEIFNEQIDKQTGVVTLPMVEGVIETMGEPEQFTEEESKQNKATSTALMKIRKRFFRDIDNRILGGVCAGIAAYFGIDTLLVRIIALLLIPFGGAVILIYLVLWMALSPAITTAQKLEMRGENITINNIERTIRKEYDEVKKSFSKFKESNTYKKGENFFSRFTRRDKTIILVIGVIVASAFLFNLPQWQFMHSPFAVFTGMSHHTGGALGHVFFPGALTFIIVLLVIGFIFKTFLKIILYIIAFVLLGSLVLKAIFWMFGGFLLMC